MRLGPIGLDWSLGYARLVFAGLVVAGSWALYWALIWALGLGPTKEKTKE